MGAAVDSTTPPPRIQYHPMIKELLGYCEGFQLPQTQSAMFVAKAKRLDRKEKQELTKHLVAFGQNLYTRAGERSMPFLEAMADIVVALVADFKQAMNLMESNGLSRAQASRLLGRAIDRKNPGLGAGLQAPGGSPVIQLNARRDTTG